MTPNEFRKLFKNMKRRVPRQTEWGFLSDSGKIYNNKDEVCVSYEKNRLAINDLIEIFNKANIKILDISSDDGNLEDVFVNITKN